MKKSGFFRGMFDGLRSTVSQPSSSGSKSDMEIDEQIKSQHFQVAKIVRHGFPFHPTALAFDPIQRLIAIGTKTGSLRILGRPGVDIHVQHVPEYAVLQIIFIVNEGSLITLCADDSLHLWNIRTKPIEIVHSLKFQRERITYIHLAFQSKWLYIGTERGNVHVVNADSFVLSGYVINWNKAIELSRKSHPGAVIHLSDCPIDNNKLLIGFDSGSIVLWDLRNKSADFRNHYPEGLKSISWHHEGRQFICSHSDGSLTTWNIRGTSKPISVVYPHAKVNKEDLKLELCNTINKVEWRTVRNGDSFIIFSGGLPLSGGPQQQQQQPSPSTATSGASAKSDKMNGTQTLTVIHGKSTTVLEMEHDIIDFITLCECPWQSDFNEPYAIVVLLYNDLVVVDLTSPGYPCFQNPYSMDLHESPVTYCLYLADCPSDLISAFYSVGLKGIKRTGFSEKEWPINGGEWGTSTQSYVEIIITGHADGSLKFWAASSVNFQILYKLKTAKIFEKTKVRNDTQQHESNQENDDPFAIEHVAFCCDTRYLCVAGASSHVIISRFVKQETHSDIPVLEIPMNNHIDPEHDATHNETEITSGMGSLLTQSLEGHDYVGTYFPLKVKAGHHKRQSGYQPELVCLTPGIDSSTPPYRITSLSINSSAGLVAYGSENGIVIIDIIQKCCVLNCGTCELYGAADPYQRIARAQKKTTTGGSSSSKDNAEGNQNDSDRCKSPTEQSCEFESPDPDTPLSAKNSVIPVNPIPPLPPPRSKRQNTEQSKQSKLQNTNTDLKLENCVRKEQNPICDKSNSLNREQNQSEFERPMHLTLKCTNSDPTKYITEIGSQDTSDELSLHSSNNSDFPSPTIDAPNCDFISESELIKSNDNVNKITSDKSIYNNNKKKKMKIIDLRSEDRDESVFTRIITSTRPKFKSRFPKNVFMINGVCLSPTSGKQQQPQQQPSSSSGAVSKKPVTPEMKRSRSAGTRSKLQKMHTIQSMVSADYDGFQNYNLIVGSGSDKIDSSFSRSRSSSVSSLENVTTEAIQSLVFVDTYCTKSDATTGLCLYVGTSLGSVLALSITLPDSNDNRILQLQSVNVTPSGSIYKLKGSILCISFLDFTGSLLQSNDSYKDGNRSDSAASSLENKRSGSLTIVRSGSGGGGSGGGGAGSSNASIKNTKISPTSSATDMRDTQFMVLVSEKQARIVNLPSQICSYKAALTDTSFAVRADVVYMKSADSVCLATYLGTGNIVVYSLPSLRILIDIDFLPLVDVRIARTICFSSNGHGMYLSSASELTKFTISASYRENIPEMIGNLFNPKEIPEQPKPSFLKGLFGGGPSLVDREELFGETAGKASKSTARHIPGAVEQVKLQTGSIGAEMARVREGLTERGERLNQLEDRTGRMMAESEAFHSAAHNVMQKYRDKKWYQF